MGLVFNYFYKFKFSTLTLDFYHKKSKSSNLSDAKESARQAISTDTNIDQKLDTDGLVVRVLMDHAAWWPQNIFEFVHGPSSPGFIWDYGLLSNIEDVLYIWNISWPIPLKRKIFKDFWDLLKKILTEWCHRKYILVVKSLWLDFKLIILGEMQIRLEVDFVFVIILFAGKCSKSLPVFSIYFRLNSQYENDIEQLKLSLHAFGWNSHLIFIVY